jgi:hydrogenase nickel incorporation protein HypA/HybF
MHELALCQAMLAQVEDIVREHQAQRVVSITLGMGPLSGVEESLLKNAYPVAIAGSLAEGAELLIRTTPIKVRCTSCGEESDATANHLVCTHCGDWRTELISGDELLLISVELDKTKTSQANALH